MKNLTNLAAQYKKAEALLLRLEAQPAELEAEREKLINAGELDAEPSAELVVLATKLSLLPTKIEQATKRLEALRSNLEEENALVAVQLGEIARDRQAKLTEALIKALKPIFSRVDQVEFGGLLGDLIQKCDGYAEIYNFSTAGNGAFMVSPITKTEQLLALRPASGL